MQMQPVENIDAVLGRFHAWAGSRGGGAKTRGIRELTEEEALRSDRYRWKGAGNASVKKKAAEEAEATAAPVPVKREVKVGRAGNHAAKPVAKAGSKGAAKPPSKFGEVLAQAVRPAEVVVAAQPLAASRQIAISVRFVPAERELIKRRAEEAGISASAYIRQCALEVEQLRTQVRDAIAAMELGEAVPVLASPPAPGFLARLVRRFFPRRQPVLALRA